MQIHMPAAMWPRGASSLMIWGILGGLLDVTEEMPFSLSQSLVSPPRHRAREPAGWLCLPILVLLVGLQTCWALT